MIVPDDVDVHLRDFGRAFPKNVAVTAVRIAPKTVRPGESASITATVFNASPLPVSKCPVRLHVEAGDQKRDLERTIDLEGGATASVAFPLEGLPEGLWRGHVEASTGDELPFDDRRFLALSVAAPARVLIVDGDPGRAPYESETYFLQAALRLAPPGERYAKTPFDVATVDLAGSAESARPGENRGRRAGECRGPRRVGRASGWASSSSVAAACSCSPATASGPK